MATNALHLTAGRFAVAAALLAIGSTATAKPALPTHADTRAAAAAARRAPLVEARTKCGTRPSASVRSSKRVLRLPTPLPRRTIVVPILMYHRINVVGPSTPMTTRRLTVDPADFARQMAWLKRNGYSTVTQRALFDALFHNRRLGRRPIVITFDDGYRDAFFKASPILLRLGMRATAYVVSGRISNGDPSFLTWPLLHALECRGIEIGSHTVTHRDLTALSDRAVLAELVVSRRTLERRLGHPVPWLAYPLGAYNARITTLARRAGYVLSVTTRPGSIQSARAPMELRRLRILDSTGVAGLAAMLDRVGA